MRLRYFITRFWYLWTALILIVINIAGIFFIVALFAKDSNNFALVRELKKPVDTAKRALDIFFLPLTFNAPKLDHYDLVIDTKDLSKLNKNLPDISKNQILTDEFKQTVKADLYFKGKKYNVDVRFRGEGEIHWAYPKKSWRIEFSKTDLVDGYRELHLIVPSDRGYIAEELNSYRARKIGLMVPDSKFVTLSVNGQGSMFYWEVEGWNTNFLERHETKSDANVYNVAVDKAQLLDNTVWYSSLVDINGWDKAVTDKSQLPDNYAELDRFLKVLALESDEDFYREFATLVDMDSFYTWEAQSVLAGTRHGERTNLRLYFNSAKGKFEFVPWNIEVHELAPGIDTTHERFVSRILSNPEYVYRRNLRLAQYVKDEKNLEDDLKYWDTKWKEIKAAVYADRRKIDSNIDAIASVKEHRALLVNNWNTVLQALKESRISMSVDTSSNSDKRLAGTITVTADSFSSAQWTSLTARLPETYAGNLSLWRDSNRNGSYDRFDERLGDLVMGDDLKQAKIALESTSIILHPGRAMLPEPDNRLVPKPLTYNFFLISATGGHVKPDSIEAIFENAVTGGKVKPIIRIINNDIFAFAERQNDTWEEVHARYPFLRRATANSMEIEWPQDTYTVPETVIIPKQFTLVVDAGTKLTMNPGVSVVSYGRVRAVGTKERQISITAADPEKPWGVFGILNATGTSTLDYVSIDGGSDAYIAGVFFSGSFNSYYSDVEMDHLTVRNAHGDDGINIKRAHTSVQNSLLEKNSFDAIDLDFTSGIIDNNTIQDNGNDGLDISGSRNVVIANNFLARNGDKGMSVGEDSAPRVINTVFLQNAIGLESKDGSKPVVVNSVFYRNATDLSLYTKKPLFAKPPEVHLANVILWGAQTAIDAEPGSIVDIHDSDMEVDWKGSNISKVVPDFSDIDGSDFTLQKESLLATMGDPKVLAPFGLVPDTVPMGLIPGLQL